MAEFVSSKDVALKQLNRSTDRIRKKVFGTPSENATPRTLIQGFLDAATVSKSAIHSLQPKRPRLTKSPQGPPPQKKRRSLRKSLGENATPRTLIRNYLNEASPETPLEIPHQAQYNAEDQDHLLQNAPHPREVISNYHFSINESNEKNSNEMPSSPETKDQNIPQQDISINRETVSDSQSNFKLSLTGSKDVGKELSEQQSSSQDSSPRATQDLQASLESASDKSYAEDEEINKELSKTLSSRSQEPTDFDISHQDSSNEIIPDRTSSSESANDDSSDEEEPIGNNMQNEISEDVAMVTDTMTTEESRNSKWKNLVTPRFPVTKRKVLDEMTNDLDENLSETKKHSTIKSKQSRTLSVPTRKSSSDANLPSNLVKSIFQHFSKRKVTKEALEVIQKGSGLFFKNMSSDLMAYCQHAGRSTIDIGDVELLMKRQGFITTKQSLHSLIEKYLPLEYRQELIPVAQSGNRILVKRS